MPGEILAQTTINEGNATIIVDVSKVNKTHDRLEPVIGHELYHIWEAYFVYGGVENFSDIVAKEKPISVWQNRSYEKSTIQRENNLRKSLKTSYPNEFNTMSLTRELQNSK